MNDLARYQVKEGDLVCAPYKQYKICSMPPPSSGGITILQILGLLESFHLETLTPYSVKAIHLIAEATKLAYADRNKYIADSPDVPLKQLLNKKYLQQRARLINPNKASHHVPAGDMHTSITYAYNPNPVEWPETTHLSVVDAYGNVISMTSSIEFYFGSGLKSDGFMLNNQLTDFSFMPTENGTDVLNKLEPGKQPRSSMSPTFVFDQKNQLIMALGSPGGAKIIQFVVKTLIAHLDWQLDIAKAIHSPNFIAMGDRLYLEENSTLVSLEKPLNRLGHSVKITKLTSGVNGFTRDASGLLGSADQRRDGLALGH
jgi:gamma-glutamyltranspeptidase/glutathione hydrolase